MDSNRLLHKARFAADAKGLDPMRLELSTRKGKRFMYITNDGPIHFGAWPAFTFLDHGDVTKRAAWRARHGVIRKGERLAYLDKTSPLYYAWRILW